MKKSPVYTRTGDAGQTSLVGGQRVAKDSARLESYGTIDELNSFIGLLAAETTDEHDTQFLTDIQAALFVVGSYLATDTSTTQLRQQSIVTPEMVETLEHEIDLIDSQLPPLRLFVLPGGTRAASLAHVCRTVCRRAERRILTLQGTLAEPLDTMVVSYVNRLSDYFFVLARRLNVIAGHDEVIWQRRK